MKEALAILLILLSLFSAVGCNKDETGTLKAPDIVWDNVGAIQLSLSSFDNAFVVGEKVLLAPNLKNGTAKIFSISPELPIGLEFNNQTGTITGVAAVIQPRTRYNLNVIDVSGKSASTALYIETKPDIFIKDASSPEVTSVSGKLVDLKSFVGGGKGGYRFEIIDPTYGSVSPDGVFTPGTKIGEAEFRVTDNVGTGTSVKFKVKVGVPRLSINYTNPIEGQPALLQLALSGKSSVPSTINYSVSIQGPNDSSGNPTYTAMADNVSLASGSVTFPAGETQATIRINTFNNNVNKDNGFFTVTLSLDNSVRFDDTNETNKQIKVVIINVNPPPKVSFDVSSKTFVEHDQNAFIKIRLDRASSKSVSVNYLLDQQLSTVIQVDHTFTDGLASFAPGETEKTVPFRIYHDINGNKAGDPDRIMSFRLTNPYNATLGSIPRQNLTVVDPMVITLSETVYDFVLLDELQNRNWNSEQSVLVRITKDGILRSTSKDRAAFSSGHISLAYGSKVTVENEGVIVGMGGAGGASHDPSAPEFSTLCNQQIQGKSGEQGGPAVSVVAPVTLVNEGKIFAGGGGGGGGVSVILGNDSNCSVKHKIFGGSGGRGADAGLAVYSQTQAGSDSSASDPYRPYTSSGGTGGTPGESGQPGNSPAQTLGNGAAGGAGGLPGFVFLDLGSNNQHLITLLRSCRFHGNSVNHLEYKVPVSCSEKYGQLVQQGALPQGLVVEELGVIKGLTK